MPWGIMESFRNQGNVEAPGQEPVKEKPKTEVARPKTKNEDMTDWERPIYLQWILWMLLIFLAVYGQSLVMLGIGAPSTLETISDKAPATICIIVGVFTILTAFGGGIWFIRGNKIAYIVHISAYITLIIITIILLIYLMVELGSPKVERHMDAAWADFEINKNAGKIAKIQLEYRCCGNEGPHDYVNINRSIDHTCYKNHQFGDLSKIYTKGCGEKIEKYKKIIMTAFLIGSIALLVVETLVVCVICIGFRKRCFYPNKTRKH